MAVVRLDVIPVLAELIRVLRRLVEAEPALAAPLARGARLSWDTVERVILVSAVQPDGTAVPVAAIDCDPESAENFGTVGLPVASDPPSPQVH